MLLCLIQFTYQSSKEPFVPKYIHIKAFRAFNIYILLAIIYFSVYAEVRLHIFLTLIDGCIPTQNMSVRNSFRCKIFWGTSCSRAPTTVEDFHPQTFGPLLLRFSFLRQYAGNELWQK